MPVCQTEENVKEQVSSFKNELVFSLDTFNNVAMKWNEILKTTMTQQNATVRIDDSALIGICCGMKRQLVLESNRQCDESESSTISNELIAIQTSWF